MPRHGKRKVLVRIGADKIRYAVEGASVVGADEVLLNRDDNLIAQTPWAAAGYTVAPVLSQFEYRKLVEGIRRLLAGIVAARVKPKNIDESRFKLERYHRAISSNSKHLALVMGIRDGFPLSELPIDVAVLERALSAICGVNVAAQHPYLGPGAFFIRIVRPGVRRDNNPPHCDAWLDRLRGAVNIYVPLAGSNTRSSLPLVPGSHLWKDSEIERTVEGAKVDGAMYRVPAVTGSTRDVKMVRPNPRPGEVMVFSPYLIHGGGVNLNADLTRVSLEMRFWRRTMAAPRTDQSHTSKD
jgi:ectoine hydroxylase-related dioxygenase (phytanoyl-CoA dioxygenase family)